MAIQHSKCRFIHSLTGQLCPFARHAPLPELQNLVRLLRPRTLSPNTLVPKCQGIEYLLLPDYFQDCLRPESLAIIKAEMSAFFDRTFGSGYLAKLQGAHIGGIMPDFDASLSRFDFADQDFEQLVAGLGAPIGAGRQSNVLNHMLRSVLGQGASNAQIHSMTDFQAAFGNEQAQQQIMRMNGQYYHGPGHRLGPHDESDDESQEKRQRRRYALESASTIESVKAESSRSAASDASRVNMATGPQQRSRGMYGLAPKAEADYKPARRFGLDKSHLQALSQVDED